MTNPFSPNFGATPTVLAGRVDVLSDFADAFAEPNPRHPGLTVLVSGTRGVGKTVLLNEYGDAARKQGWLIIDEGSSPGLLDRLARDHLPRLLTEHAPHRRRRLTGGGATLGPIAVSASWEDRYPVESTLRTEIAELLDVLAEHGSGLVITVDEVQSATVDELRKLGEIVQFARREHRLLGFAAAGLSSHMEDLLNHPGTTFLRRAMPYAIGNIDDVDEISDVIRRTVELGHKRVSLGKAEELARMSGGYPFMIQLLGFHVWQLADTAATLDDVDMQVARDRARRQLGRQVHAPVVRSLANGALTYLQAMAVDEGPSATGEIAKRLGVSAQHANVYRTRLIDEGIIEKAGWGKVRFTIPYLEDYLREQSSGDTMLL